MRATPLLLCIAFVGGAGLSANADSVGAKVGIGERATVCYYNASSRDILLLDFESNPEVVAYSHSGVEFFTPKGLEEEHARRKLEHQKRVDEAERTGVPYTEWVPEIIAPEKIYWAQSRLVVPSQKAECEDTVTASNPHYEEAFQHDRAKNWGPYLFFPPSWMRPQESTPKFLRENFGDNWVYPYTNFFVFAVRLDMAGHFTDRGSCPVILGTEASIEPAPQRCAQDLLDEAAVEAISIAEDRYFAR